MVLSFAAGGSLPTPTPLIPDLESMAAPLIYAQNLSKAYKVYGSPWDRLREMLLARSSYSTIRALHDVSFELERGESLGIVGENGAGKSTLLKLLAGVTQPSEGTLHLGGSVASLLELGMGFHSEFTGRQNIRLNAAMMGLSEAEVAHKTPEIVEFSELGDFIDRPVKTYSTGMVMRLGFSIAVQMEPEILIVDEALSVGDGYFQKKCMDRIRSFLESGRTLFFCSHAMYYVTSLCQRALWLEKGQVRALGPAAEVVREYENHLLEKGRSHAAHESAQHRDQPSKLARITAVRQLGAGGEAERFRTGEPWILEVEWETRDPGLVFHVGVGIDRIDGVQICSVGTHRDGLEPLSGSEHYAIRLLVPELPILKGRYSLYVFLLDEQGLHVYEQELLQTAFSIETEGFPVGLFTIGHRWDLEPSTRPVALAEGSVSQMAVGEGRPQE